MSDRPVVLELAGQPKLARDLAAGGVFVPGVQIPLNEDCELVLRGSADEVVVRALVVFANDHGIGVQLHDCDAELKQRIAELAASAEAAASEGATADAAATEEATADAAADPAGDAEPAPPEVADADAVAADADADAALAADEVGEEASDATGDKKHANVHERLRGLTLAQQVKIAHHGEVSERIVLERMYGKNVWEALLRNPRLTGPEVARIARMGALPRPLMEIIVGNGAWLQIPEVRRALLSNPRLGADQIMRVLRLLPKHELKLAGMQTVYPMAVRDAAKRLIKEAGG